MTPTFMTVSSDRGAVEGFARRPFFTDLIDAASGWFSGSLADGFSPDLLHRMLDRYAELCLSLDPDAGGIRHRFGIPFHRRPRAAL
jgi:hypothetical protein